MIKWLLRKFEWFRKLERNSMELGRIHRRVEEVRTWCGYEFPEAGCAAKWIMNPYDCQHSSGAWGGISHFREGLRSHGSNREYSIKQPFIEMERTNE